MKNININLSKDSVYTEPMHNILGINNIPRIHSYAINLRETEEFSKFNFKYIRFHDAPLENPGQQLVDISRIFPLFHADETKAENYFFLQTDDYMRSIENSDAEIDFRVGESIDHSENGRLIGCPPDIDKWARICRNIIAQYKIGENPPYSPPRNNAGGFVCQIPDLSKHRPPIRPPHSARDD